MADDWAGGESDEKDVKYDDFQLGAEVADHKDLKALDESTEMGPPVGTHTFFVKAIKLSENKDTGEPEEQPNEVYVNGEKVVYFSYRMDVDLAWKEDPVKTVRATFRLPPGLGREPARAKEVEYYMKGTKEDKKATSQNTGVFWRMLKHFLGHLGIPIREDGAIPSFNGKMLKFWPSGVPREIVATVEIQKGSEKKYKSIAMFSYKDAESTLMFRVNPDRPASDFVSEKAKSQAASIAETLVDVDI